MLRAQTAVLETLYQMLLLISGHGQWFVGDPVCFILEGFKVYRGLSTPLLPLNDRSDVAALVWRVIYRQSLGVRASHWANKTHHLETRSLKDVWPCETMGPPFYLWLCVWIHISNVREKLKKHTAFFTAKLSDTDANIKQANVQWIIVLYWNQSIKPLCLWLLRCRSQSQWGKQARRRPQQYTTHSQIWCHYSVPQEQRWLQKGSLCLERYNL